MDIKTIVTIGVIGILIIAGIMTYQFVKPYYDEYRVQKELEYKKSRMTDPALVEGMNKYLDEGNQK